MQQPQYWRRLCKCRNSRRLAIISLHRKMKVTWLLPRQLASGLEDWIDNRFLRFCEVVKQDVKSRLGDDWEGFAQVRRCHRDQKGPRQFWFKRTNWDSDVGVGAIFPAGINGSYTIWTRKEAKLRRCWRKSDYPWGCGSKTGVSYSEGLGTRGGSLILNH